ncbi:MAG: ABC transporter substrate-binding protein [Omnitrophica WOR_2 bacterium]
MNMKFSIWKLIIITILVSTVLALPLAGCQQAAQPATTTEAVKPVEEVKPTEPPAQQPVTMTFWDPSTDEGINKVFDQMFTSFHNKYPYITVEDAHQGDYVKKLNTAFAAGSTPDLIWAWANPMTFYDYVNKGLIKDLDAEYKEYGWQKYFPDSMYKAMLGPDGKPYGVPDFINGTVIAYNKDIFDKNGLAEPQNWDDWMKVLDTLKKNGVTPIGMGLSDGNWQAKRLFEVILNATAGKQWTEDLYAGKHPWTSPEVIDALKKLEAVGPYVSEGSLGMNSRQGWDMWYQGQVAMIVSDTWQFSLHDRDAKFKWDFFTFPKIKSDVTTTFVGAVSDVMYIPKTSAHPKEAVLFLNHFLTPELQGYWIDAKLPFAAGGYFGLITTEKLGAANVKLMDYISKNGFTTWFDVGNKSEISNELAPTQFAGVLNGQIKPEDAAKAIEDVAKPLFNR